MARPRRLAILGSTGSLGIQALEICQRFPDRFDVVALGASGARPELLARQAQRFGARWVAITREQAVERLRSAGVSPPAHVIVAGPDALEQVAALPDLDLVVVLTVGLAGLGPTLAALRAGHPVALANKEVLVAAGELMPVAELVRSGRILPVDSEHSAIWQSLLGESPLQVRRLWLTASGGPFWGWSADQLRQVTPQQALAHPTWRMGPRVTVDSATLVNKGFEVIEAHHLFGVGYDAIGVVVHRQSVVHSMVEFADGSVKAQLSLPDMRLPILFALSYPERLAYDGVPPLWGDGTPVALSFQPLRPGEEPRGIALARQAAQYGRTYPAVLAAADEVAVDAFLQGRLPFDRILDVVEATLQAHDPERGPLTLQAVRAADAWATKTARERCTTLTASS